MAAALFQDLLARREDGGDWRVESAGTWVPQSLPASAPARAILAEKGMSLEDHRSRGVDRDLLGRQDLILVMEAGHRESLLAEFPDTAGRVFLLAAMTGEGYDIRDPIGATWDSYRELARELWDLLEHGYERIASLARTSAHGRTLVS
jgi:protein-tyrosine phosphatase